MCDSELIDESEPVPTIAGRRIDMLDVMAAMENPDPEEQFYDDWGLSEDQVEAAIEYISDHRDVEDTELWEGIQDAKGDKFVRPEQEFEF